VDQNKSATRTMTEKEGEVKPTEENQSQQFGLEPGQPHTVVSPSSLKPHVVVLPQGQGEEQQIKPKEGEGVGHLGVQPEKRLPTQETVVQPSQYMPLSGISMEEGVKGEGLSGREIAKKLEEEERTRRLNDPERELHIQNAKKVEEMMRHSVMKEHKEKI